MDYMDYLQSTSLKQDNLFVCLSVCVYLSSPYSFGPINMKLGMNTPWDPGSDME